MKKRLPRPSPALLVAVVAVVIACAGSATAATVITGKQIKNSSITSTDIKNASLLAKDFKKGQLKAGARGPAGPAGAAGSPGKDGQNGAPGTARAYGSVAADGTLTRAKNATVNRSASLPGHFCISVPGASPSTHSMVVTPIAEESSTYWGGAAAGIGDQSVAEVRSSSGACTDPNDFSVITGVIDFNNSAAVAATQQDQGFSFVVG